MAKFQSTCPSDLLLNPNSSQILGKWWYKYGANQSSPWSVIILPTAIWLHWYFRIKLRVLHFYYQLHFTQIIPHKKSFQLKLEKQLTLLSPLWLTSFCLHFILHLLIVLSLDHLSKCYLFYTGFRMAMITAQMLSKVYNIWDWSNVCFSGCHNLAVW